MYFCNLIDLTWVFFLLIISFNCLKINIKIFHLRKKDGVIVNEVTQCASYHMPIVMLPFYFIFIMMPEKRAPNIQ